MTTAFRSGERPRVARSGPAQRPRHLPPSGRAALLVAALALLAVPVSYRGGADVAHPHAFLQLWLDAAAGSTDHHRHHADGRADAHAAPHETRGVATGRDPASDLAALRAAEPDRPVLSAMAGGTERATAIAAVISSLFWSLLARPPLGSSRQVPLRGRGPRPTTPPPREAAWLLGAPVR